MKRWQRNVLGATAAAIGGGAAAVSAGSTAWNQATARAVARLTHDAAATDERFSPERMDGLPGPVRRYFEYALTPGRRLIRTARVTHAGRFRTGLEAGWMRFHSVQVFTARPPGFVWDARIRMAPLLSIRVRDSYVNGAGSMLGSIASVVPVVDVQGGPELAAGALHRYLAEAVWLPTALLPSSGVRWDAVDDFTARATMTDGETSVWLDFRFDAEGRILEVFTPARFRDVNGTGVPTPWTGRFHDWVQVDGVRIPTRGEVDWLLPEGTLTYWRGRVTSVSYD